MPKENRKSIMMNGVAARSVAIGETRAEYIPLAGADLLFDGTRPWILEEHRQTSVPGPAFALPDFGTTGAR